ncbi:MAG: DUF1925 domain-containing protein [Spirochaetaceae bacterium]|jgi:hypothetical protein|nr:DUF1925 domain-containing protein [Spirochaetaceae bacterium]
MTGKISLILGSHAHFSPSMGEEEFEVLYRNKLKPFITAVNQHGKIQAVLHYSGPLLCRLEQKKPAFFMLIKELVARKRLEILGGGFYEPLLPLLPPTDRIGQIEMLTTYVRKNFGRKPQGCWLARNGWDQSLVGVLNTCGMGYTFLTEERFLAAGCSGESLFSPVFTEDQGKLLAVFPVFSSLAGMGTRGAAGVLRNIPDSAVVTVFPEFSAAQGEEGAETFFADLSGFLLEKGGVELTTPGKVYRTCGALPRVYFSACEDRTRDCLIRFEEANDLYSKIFFINTQINQLRGDKSRKRAAREELWKAQCMEALSYDHEGGISLPAVRRHSYRAILASERITREKEFKPSLLAFDFNLNSTLEYLFQDKNINCYVRTRGAAVFELDYLPRGWNYLDTFSGKGRRRCAFMDRLLPGDFIPQGADFSSPQGRFCGEEEYRVESLDRQKLTVSFVLPPRRGLPFGSIEIQKTYRLEKNMLHLLYVLRNRGDEKTVLCFIPQFDLSFAGEGGPILFKQSQGEEGLSEERGGIKKRVLALEEQNARYGASFFLDFQMPCDLYYYPVAAEGHCQSTCFLPVFQLFLNPGGEWQNQISLTVSARTRSPKNYTP